MKKKNKIEAEPESQVLQVMLPTIWSTGHSCTLERLKRKNLCLLSSLSLSQGGLPTPAVNPTCDDADNDDGDDGAVSQGGWPQLLHTHMSSQDNWGGG